jgi:hypothetical protein
MVRVFAGRRTCEDRRKKWLRHIRVRPTALSARRSVSSYGEGQVPCVRHHGQSHFRQSLKNRHCRQSLEPI